MTREALYEELLRQCAAAAEAIMPGAKVVVLVDDGEGLSILRPDNVDENKMVFEAFMCLQSGIEADLDKLVDLDNPKPRD